MQKISFQSDGFTIRGTVALPAPGDRPFPGVVIFHGMTSSDTSYVPLVKRLAGRGIAGLAISMRGHGGSDGNFAKETVGEALNDATAAYDFLVSQPGVDAARIGLVGSSVGAILASMATAQRSVKSLVFRAPAAYTDEMLRLSMAGTMVNEKQQFHHIENLAGTPAGHAIGKFEGCLLVVASGKDTVIPMAVSKGYVDIARRAGKKQLRVIEGAAHTLTDRWKEIFSSTAIDWFEDTL